MGCGHIIASSCPHCLCHSSSESVAEGVSALAVDKSKGTAIPSLQAVTTVIPGVGAFQSRAGHDPVLRCLSVWHWGSVVAPIAIASQTLAPAEKTYAQIEKEGLAFVFDVKRFHNWVFCRPFTLVTNHKLLMSQLDEQRAIQAHDSARIQHWALTLSTYQNVWAFRTSTQNGNADAMSCLLLPGPAREPPIPAETVLLLDNLNALPVTASQIRTWTRRDPLLSCVLRLVQEGWPRSQEEKGLQPFASQCAKLSVQDGCILCRNQVVIPSPGRPRFGGASCRPSRDRQHEMFSRNVCVVAADG